MPEKRSLTSSLAAKVSPTLAYVQIQDLEGGQKEVKESTLQNFRILSDC